MWVREIGRVHQRMMTSGPVYKSVSLSAVNAGMILAIQLSLKNMETNEVATKWGCNLFWSDSVGFIENYNASVEFVLTLTPGVSPYAVNIAKFLAVIVVYNALFIINCLFYLFHILISM